MGKGKGQFRYVKQYKKPKLTKQIKPISRKNEDDGFKAQALGVALYFLSFACLLLACYILGVF